MPQPSAFDAMSPEDFDRFGAEFALRNFKDVDGMVGWLAAQGYEIKRGAVWRAGNKIKRKLQAVKDSTQAARMIVESSKDDEASLSEAVIAMVQSQMFDVMTSLEEADEETDAGVRLKLLGNAARAMADSSRASLTIKKHRLELQAKARLAAEEVARLAQKGGLSPAAVESIRQQILGIAA